MGMSREAKLAAIKGLPARLRRQAEAQLREKWAREDAEASARALPKPEDKED